MNSSPTQHLAKADPIMRRLIRAHGPYGLQPRSGRSPFESLACAIAHQQLNGTAANTILGRFVKLFPGRKFPRPEDLASVTDDAVRGAGFSRAKIAALRDLAVKALDGTVPSSRAIQKLNDNEIIARLSEVRGVGQWTVEMLLIFKLGRLDVLPVDDYGVRKGFMLAYRKRTLPKPTALLKHAERWRPYRSIGAWYMWRAIELAKRAET
jgi:DNA-3-methyladenine glycosylase II